MPQIETQAHSEIFSNLNGLTNPLVILTELEFNPEVSHISRIFTYLHVTIYLLKSGVRHIKTNSRNLY